MKKLRVVAKVFDSLRKEYVQRYAEIAVSEEVIKGIQEGIHPNGDGPSAIKAAGHGDTTESLPLETMLRNQKRFHIDPQLQLIDVDDETGEETIIGGWLGM